MEPLLLVGTGRMARAYAAALSALGVPVRAVGRSAEHAQAFSAETGIPASGGGVAHLAKSGAVPRRAILAIDVGELPLAAEQLLSFGITTLLLEKPGGLSKRSLIRLAERAAQTGATVAVGYNRRYLGSVREARTLIAEDGGARACHFEFNERTSQPERIRSLDTPETTVKHWFLANSTHVIDLAWYLAGEPRALAATTAAGPLWAPHPTLFSGAGITAEQASFTYFANWEIDGPWVVEVGTARRRFILQPLEKLFVEENGVRREVAGPDNLDVAYRPGLYRQVELFLREPAELPTLAHQIERFDWYERIAGVL